MIQINPERFVVIGGTGNHDLDSHILKWINETINRDFEFTHIDFDEFSDKEPDFRIPDYKKFRDKIVIIFQSVYSNELEKELLDIVWAAKYQYGAKAVIVVITFFRYRRQDHPEKEHEINRNLEFVQELKHKGVDKLIVCDIHSQTTLDNCRQEGIAAYNVSGAQVFADRIMPIKALLERSIKKIFVYSPDGGSIGRAVSLAKILDIPVLVDFKERDFSGKVRNIEQPARLKAEKEKYQWEIELATAELINGAFVCTHEDELANGSTAKLAGDKLRDWGARYTVFGATHPVCNPGWKRTFIQDSPYDMIMLGNTIPRPYKKETGGRVITVMMSRPIAQQLLIVMAETEEEIFFPDLKILSQ